LTLATAAMTRERLPDGVDEKDLCLDVALRLGKIIEQRLPGADVVYTRSDDTFVPLEERNEHCQPGQSRLVLFRFMQIRAGTTRRAALRRIT